MLLDALTQRIPFQRGRTCLRRHIPPVLHAADRGYPAAECRDPTDCRDKKHNGRALRPVRSKPNRRDRQPLPLRDRQIPPPLRSVGNAHHMQAILKTHDPQPYRTMLEVRVARLRHGVEIDINHIIQHAHGSAHSALELAVRPTRLHH